MRSTMEYVAERWWTEGRSASRGRLVKKVVNKLREDGGFG